MNKIKIIILQEYLMNVKKRSTWITTGIIPAIFLLMEVFKSYFGLDDSPSQSPIDAAAVSQILAMCIWLFLIMYGAFIFNSVRFEKSNKIVEIILSSVSAFQFMAGKIIAVSLLGLTQIAVWAIALLAMSGGSSVIHAFLAVSSPLYVLSVGFFCFIGGYLFYGSIYAAFGALTDPDNSNQQYMVFVTVLLLVAFYSGIYVAQFPDTSFSNACLYIPFTSPIAIMAVLPHGLPLWKLLTSLLVLIGFSLLSLFCAGKVFAGSILLKGKKFSFADIIKLLKS
jgi:ABC-2 type transport system permease protein